ncbi:hypothetical protein AN958_09041 [Leucoagaricus sp. SymC.cos]|nr:hypothetical protein AN958_09041 [Leucoagaricus sp. SymC.cos]
MENFNAVLTALDPEKSSLPNPLVSGDSLTEDPSDSAVEVRIKEQVWWKVDRYILPLTILIYLLSWLDRANISNARVVGMQSDLRLSATEYSTALTVTFVPYIITEIPSNVVLKIIGPNILLPVLLICWGVVSTLQGVVKNYAGLLACRFFLGLFEGGLSPGLVLYLSCFYPRHLLQLRIALLFMCISLAGAFSGLLATVISKMDGIGGRSAWSWIFILEGLVTIVFGMLCFWILPNGPETAWFFSKEEKEYVVLRLKESKATSDDDGFSWREVWETFRLPHIWILAVNAFLGSSIVLSLAYFAPSIVLSLGFSPVQTQLMSVPPFATAFIVTVIAAILADKYRARGITVFISSLVSISGYILYLCSVKKWTLYGSLFLILAGGSAMAPAWTTWQANNTSPHIRRATGVAFLIMMTNCSAILTVWLYGGTLSAPPRYRKAMTVMLIFACLVEVGVVLNMWWLARENRRKRRVRERGGMKREDEPKGLGDRSVWFEYIL